jgi:hypothetical protein
LTQQFMDRRATAMRKRPANQRSGGGMYVCGHC